MIGVGRMIEVDQAEVVCVEALMHTSCALQAATGHLRLTDDHRHVFVHLGATQAVLKGLQRLQSFVPPGGTAYQLWNRLVYAPIVVYNDSEAAGAARRELDEADTQQEG